MKKLIFFLFIFVTFSFYTNAQSVKGLTNRINHLLNKMDSLRFENITISFDAQSDSLDKLNGYLIKDMISFAWNSPGFFQKDIYGFEKDNDYYNHFYSNTSPDKKFKIVYWQNGSGGTIKDYQYIIFWQKDNQLQYRIVDTSIANSYIDTIHHIKQKNGDDLYFTISEFEGGPGSYRAMDILCSKIDHEGNLTEEYPAFKTSTKTLSHISVNVDLFAERDAAFKPGAMIYFDKTGRNLYIQIFSGKKSEAPDDDFDPDERQRHYFVYQFDGTNFVYKKKL